MTKKVYNSLICIVIFSLFISPFQVRALPVEHSPTSIINEATETTCLDFSTLNPRTSVEGLGTVYPDLNISSPGNVVAIQERTSPTAYSAPSSGAPYINGGTSSLLGGFHDVEHVHEYDFTFSANTTVDLFSLQMLDYGDFNPNHATEHQTTLTAYDAANNVISEDVLSFTSDGKTIPRGGSAGDLWVTGDAVTAEPGEPGNYIFEVSGNSITRVELRFSSNLGDGATDPLFGLAMLCFQPEEIDPPNSICLDFAALGAGTSVEGLGAVYPDLNISSPGNVVAIQERTSPTAYKAPSSGDPYINGGTSTLLGGFHDMESVHEYDFTFSANTTVDLFSLQMLDYGDFNPNHATEHDTTLTAYDAANNIVSEDVLSFTSDGKTIPRGGSAGDLWVTGDAVTAKPGEPGNYIFEVSGNSIARVELRFSSNLGDGATDPLFGFSVLCFEPTPPPPLTTCDDFGLITVDEMGWDEHVIRDMTPVDLEFVRPFGAEFAIVNTGWEWTGNPGEEQVTELHSVTSSIGSTISEDYGNEELEGEIIWYDSLSDDFDDAQLNVTIDYAGDGSDPGSHQSHGEVLWCAEELPELPPVEYQTCEDLDMVTLAWDSWTYHIMRGDDPIELAFSAPDNTDYVLINTGWEWTGRANQTQVTEKHAVSSPVGSTTSEDYGDEELAGTVYWYDLLKGEFTESELSVLLNYAGNGSDPGSHRSHGMIKWCSTDTNNP